MKIEGDPSKGLNGAVAAELRAEKAAVPGMTLDSLAAECGVPKTSLQRYLAGGRHMEIQVIDRIAAPFGLSALDVVAAATRRLKREVPEQLRRLDPENSSQNSPH